MPANSGLLKIPARSLVSKFAQSQVTFSEDTEAEVFDQQRRLMSAFGGEADMPSTSRYVAE